MDQMNAEQWVEFVAKYSNIHPVLVSFMQNNPEYIPIWNPEEWKSFSDSLRRIEKEDVRSSNRARFLTNTNRKEGE